MPERKFLENFEEPKDDAPQTTPPPATQPAPETQQKAAEPAKEAASPPAAPAEGTPEAAKDPKEAAYWKGLSDEREKRRQATEEAAYWRGRAEAAAAKAAPAEDQEKIRKERENDFLVDPVTFTEKTVEERVERRLEQERWQRSIYSVEREHKDWIEKRDKFLKLAEKDPTLEQKVRLHPDPARYAYEYVKQVEMASQPLDVEAERKRIRAEVEADLRKEMALSAAGNSPPTLAGAPGAGGSGSAGHVPDVNELFEGKSF